MRIVFYPQACLPFHAYTLDERPLGGVETGIIRLARALHERGHEILVYTTQQNPPPSEPAYRWIREASQMAPCDAFICIREWFPLISRIPCRKRFLWTGDNADQIQTFGLGDRRVARSIDGLLTVGTWQAETLCEVSGFPRSKVYVLRNGIHPPYFIGAETRSRKRLIYSSTPFRGLHLLPPMFGKLREKHPNAELFVFSGFKVYAREDGTYNTQIEQRYDPLLRSLAGVPGVTIMGNVTQSALAREMMKSAVMAYPNIYQETCCISAMEAQAAGVPIVTSALAGLPETVGEAGILLTEQPGTPQYAAKFIEAIDHLLSDDAYFERLSRIARQRASEMSWAAVAEKFERYLIEQHGLV